MIKDGKEVLQGTSLGMENLHQKIIGVVIESISYNKIIHNYYYHYYYYSIIIIIIIIIILLLLSLLLLLYYYHYYYYLLLLLLQQLLIIIIILLLLYHYCYCYCYYCCYHLTPTITFVIFFLFIRYWKIHVVEQFILWGDLALCKKKLSFSLLDSKKNWYKIWNFNSTCNS